MHSLFQHKKAQPLAAEPPEPPKGWLRPESAATLLATTRRQKLLEHIWQRTSLSRPQFNTLYLTPLQRYAELVQRFPASESHHHAYHGGMLDHGLEIVAYALKLRQSHLLPVGASPEDQAAQSEAWTAAVTYAALLHDIGKIAVDVDTVGESDDVDSASPEVSEPTPASNTPAMATEPITPASANAIDELITLMEPTHASPEPEVQTPPAPVEMPPIPSEQEQATAPSAEHFMDWLKHAIATHELILNDAKALVHTVDNTAFLVTPGIFQRYAQEHPQTAILAKKTGQQDWQWLQKRFEKLNLHCKHPSGLNIWTCDVTGPRKTRRLHGYLLVSTVGLFEHAPSNNPYLLLLY